LQKVDLRATAKMAVKTEFAGENIFRKIRPVSGVHAKRATARKIGERNADLMAAAVRRARATPRRTPTKCFSPATVWTWNRSRPHLLLKISCVYYMVECGRKAARGSWKSVHPETGFSWGKPRFYDAVRLRGRWATGTVCARWGVSGDLCRSARHAASARRHCLDRRPGGLS
jgi:hypothetical protein